MLCLNINPHMDGVCILILPASDIFVFYLAPLLFLSTTAFSHFTYYTQQPAGSAFSFMS